MSNHLKCVRGMLAALAATALFMGTAVAQNGNTQVPLPGSSIPQWVNQLPLLSVAGGTIDTAFGNRPLTINMCEFDSAILPLGTPVVPAPPAGQSPKTRTFGYALNACPASRDVYLGPVLVNARGYLDPGNPTAMPPVAPSWKNSTDITFVNNLGNAASTQVPPIKYAIDKTVFWADPENNEANACYGAGGVPAFGTDCAKPYAGPIPAVVHLHGGEVPPGLDGGPDSWYTWDGKRGHGYWTFGSPGANAATFNYPNGQEASPVWFHDHALGMTRLNVYAGLAGAYLIYDTNRVLPAGLDVAGLWNGANGVEFVVPMVVQDRMFDTAGQLFFPADSYGGLLWSVNPEHPYWVPEFIGDTIVVNGKAWPSMTVEPKRYRFWFINGSNARTYNMFLVNPVTKLMGPPIYVIATDGGYLDSPAKLDPNAVPMGSLLMMSGERNDVIIDFGGLPQGTTLILKNNARSPYPKGAAPNGSTLGQLVKFVVGPCTSGKCGANDTSYNPALGAPIRTGTNSPAFDNQKIVRLVNPATGTLAAGVTAKLTRQLTLNEVLALPSVAAIDPVTGAPNVAYPGGPMEILINNTKYNGASGRLFKDFTAITAANGKTTYYTELPQEGDTEVWELVNLTADAHPIHLHLVQFQIMNRQAFDTKKYPAAYAAAFPGGLQLDGWGPPLDYNTGKDSLGTVLNARAIGGNPDVVPFLQGPVKLPDPNEAGWKDTIRAMPGEVTRIAVRWAPTDLPTTTPAGQLSFPFSPDGIAFGAHGYVWHCHIVDHEDNEMMRPDAIMLNPLAPAPSARPLQAVVNY